ncbi:MAG: hypothetical protein AAF367_02360 [Pseudomonadota bacterium]
MGKTLTSGRNRSERGTALLEAAIGVGLLALIAATGLSAFSRAGEVSRLAEARIDALALAENALELASASAFLGIALQNGEAQKSGTGWQVIARPYRDDESDGPIAMLEITAVAEVAGGPDVTLRTLRALPR